MICQACSRGRHEECSAQVLAGTPCTCVPCWGEDGSQACYNRIPHALRGRVLAREKWEGSLESAIEAARIATIFLRSNGQNETAKAVERLIEEVTRLRV